jgi:hypothetical protein
MRGSVIKRSKTSWSLVFRDANGKQKWVKFTPPRGQSTREAQKAAEAELAKPLHQVNSGGYVDASKTTLVEYLRDWHQKSVAPHRRPETARIYPSMIDRHVAKAPIAAVPLQKLRASDLEAFYATVKLAPSSVTVLPAARAPTRSPPRDADASTAGPVWRGSHQSPAYALQTWSTRAQKTLEVAASRQETGELR